MDKSSVWEVLFAATVLSLSTAFVTAAAAALVVGTEPWVGVVLPGAVVGAGIFALTFWRVHRGESVDDIWRSVRDLRDAFSKTFF